MGRAFARRGPRTPSRTKLRYRGRAGVISPKRVGKAYKAKTRTRTRTATKRKLNQGVHETRGGSESTFRLTYKASPMGRLTGKMAKLAYILNANQIASGGAGTQDVTDVYTLGSATDLQAMMTQALTQQYGSATPTGYKTERIMVKSVQAEYAYNNNTNDQVRLQLYDITPRTDIYNSTNDAKTPFNAWAVGLSHEISGGGGGPVNIVGAVPFASEMFCHFYKVVKITNVTLAPGQTHYHRVRFAPNKIMTNEVLQQGNLNSFRGLSLCHMAVQYGAPCLDNGAGVTTESTKVLMVTRINYEYTYLPNNMTSITTGNSLGTTAGANIENMVTGAASAFAAV